MSDNRLEVGGCFCCAKTRNVDFIGEVMMPDGRIIHQYKDRIDDSHWWVDPKLNVTWEGRDY